MQPLSVMPEGQTAASAFTDDGDANASGVSWGAIFAGAAAAGALSFILIILGFGLGLSAVSPWANSGASATTIGRSTIVWRPSRFPYFILRSSTDASFVRGMGSA